jgi:hypothetical protein
MNEVLSRATLSDSEENMEKTAMYLQGQFPAEAEMGDSAAAAPSMCDETRLYGLVLVSWFNLFIELLVLFINTTYMEYR